MNQVTLIGNLTKRPDKAFTQDNRECSRFTVAVNMGNDKVEYIDCVAWDKLAITCNTYLDKGKKVAVTGEMRSHKWVDNTGRTNISWNVRIYNMEMLSPKSETMYASSQSNTEELNLPPLEKELPKQSDFNEAPTYNSWTDDDVPF